MPEPSSHFSTKAMDEDDIRDLIKAAFGRQRSECGRGWL
jgi:hypothetical protein